MTKKPIYIDPASLSEDSTVREVINSMNDSQKKTMCFIAYRSYEKGYNDAVKATRASLRKSHKEIMSFIKELEHD